ncbi:MAG TPA: hypothetical protein VET88_00335 [Gammaproteobacteria bacterium]|nr:hypothetical protein [Gammaproteobacteria bacterium]
MADLFSVTAPLLIRYPDATLHVMVHRLRHPQGLVYFRTFWDRMPPAEGIVLVAGEIRGDGPWKVGDAVVTLLGCHGSHPAQAAEYADWQLHLAQSPDAYPGNEQLLALAREHLWN